MENTNYITLHEKTAVKSAFGPWEVPKLKKKITLMLWGTAGTPLNIEAGCQGFSFYYIFSYFLLISFIHFHFMTVNPEMRVVNL